MAAPTMPTADSIVTEGVSLAHSTTSPDTYWITRGKNEWLEEIKNDIAVLSGGKKLEFLQSERVLALTDGLQKYSMPTDYLANLSMQLLDGQIQGTATAGATTTITLAATETVTTSEMIGREIVTTGGTGPNQFAQCTGYNETTKVATVSPAWAVTPPASGTTYMVVSSYRDITPSPLWISTNMQKGAPESYAPKGDADDGEFLLFPVPYRNETGKVYALKQRYYIDLMELDLAGTLMGTLYKRWRSLWVQGVKTRAYQSIHASEAAIEKKIYNNMLLTVVGNEIYGANLSNLQIQITDS